MAYSFSRSDVIGPRVVVPGSAGEMAILAFLIVVTLYFGQAVLVPLALAVILSFVLAPAVRLLRRIGLPNTPAVLLVVVIAFAIIFGIGALITQQVEPPHEGLAVRRDMDLLGADAMLGDLPP